MKTIFKIAAIAAITALAVISCGPPELPSAHNEYWDNYNDQFDATKYTGKSGDRNAPSVDTSKTSLTAYADTYTDVKKDNIVTISFPDTADVLKKGALTTADLNFISFYTYDATAAKKAEEDATTSTPNTAATSLNALSGWSFDRRNVNDIIVKLPALSTAGSKVVYKLDSSVYTYSNGLKLDIDGNGIAGEKGYDDIYKILSVGNITINTNPVLPERKNFVVYLTDWADSYGTTDTSTAKNYSLVSTNFSSYVTTSDYESILKTLAPGFKVESFSNGSWSNFATGSFGDTTSKIIAKDIQLSHNKAYRVVFEKGSISLETAKEFYGLKQRIKISGSSGEITENAKVKKTRVEGVPGIYINTTKRVFEGFSKWVPPVTHWENDTNKPLKGYWNPGFEPNSDFDETYNKIPNPDYEDEILTPGEPPFITLNPSDPGYTSPYDIWQPENNIVNTNWDDYSLPDNEPPYSLSGFDWDYTSEFEATSYEQKLVVDSEGYLAGNVTATINSQDSLGGKVVLKLEMRTPISLTTATVTTNHYFKSLDLAAFKNNFKIYSASGYDLKNSNDVVEIGIEKADFKVEGIAETATEKIKGSNVIYITLDQKYRNDGKGKYFYIGEGFGYADDVTVFSSERIWDNKGFATYKAIDF